MLYTSISRGEKMKKTFNSLLFIVLMSLFINKVSAADCNKYSCATCTYENGSYKIVYELKADGSGIANLTSSYKLVFNPNNQKLVVDDTLSVTNFINKKNNNLKCLDSIFILPTAGSQTTKSATIYHAGNKEKSSIEIKLTKEENNNKLLSEGEVYKRSCLYKEANKAGTQGQKMDITTTIILDNQNKLNYSFSNGYQFGGSDLTADMFVNSCPDISISCGSSGNNKFCTLSKKAVGGGSEMEGDNNPSGDEIINPNPPTTPGGSDNNWQVDHIGDIQCGELKNIPGVIPKLTNLAVNIMKILVPIALVIKSMIDFAKATTAQKEDEMKKAQSKFIKRLIIAFVFFFTVLIFQFMFRIVATVTENNTLTSCINCFINNRCE